MNQAVLSLPVKLLYTALQFLINFYYFSKSDMTYQVYLFNRHRLVFAGISNTLNTDLDIFTLV